ncbi:hypothetical protein ACFRCG_28435 [Embleya sp. NPDC056575]|uniref:hypothetical protein n=1 Tax=unclassified Embleya TaxID=2699296 RepID=UPI0036CAD803
MAGKESARRTPETQTEEQAVSGGFQAAYDEISRGLDLPVKVTATTAATSSASVRHSIAHRIQRDLLRG